MDLINSIMHGLSKDEKYDQSPNYYDWREIFPQLQILRDNIEILKIDSQAIESVS
jgi:hypothetical protein